MSQHTATDAEKCGHKHREGACKQNGPRQNGPGQNGPGQNGPNQKKSPSEFRDLVFLLIGGLSIVHTS